MVRWNKIKLTKKQKNFLTWRYYNTEKTIPIRTTEEHEQYKQELIWKTNQALKETITKKQEYLSKEYPIITNTKETQAYEKTKD